MFKHCRVLCFNLFVLSMAGIQATHTPETAMPIQEIYTMAQKAYLNEEYHQATQLFSQIRHSYPNSPYAEKAHLGIIEAQIATKHFKAARIQYRNFLRLYPNSQYKLAIFEIRNRLENQASWISFQTFGKVMAGVVGLRILFATF